MRKLERKELGDRMRYELMNGTHTYTMCKCGRRGTRSRTCWECILEMFENGMLRSSCTMDCNCDCHLFVGGSGKACPDCKYD